jgi:hypothetical protein
LARTVLAAIDEQTSGESDPRLQAKRVESLLLLGRDADARAVADTLLASGYRDANFIVLVRANDIASKP